MTTETMFSGATYIAILGWAFLLLLPGWRWTARLVSSVLIPGLLSAIYMYLIVTYMSEASGNFESLGGVSRLFENEYMLLAGWVHYLAFDLFVGVWELQDSRRLGMMHWYVAPCLLFTFLFGPIGLLMYFVIRLIQKGAIFIDFPTDNDSEDN
ncbi:MAG: DUF4281 domain-containing protein [Candidatus Latescibacteria bacterium]|nr:DUF4281 domain-containing protein [Candidatus Latescibacterota bacterium]